MKHQYKSREKQQESTVSKIICEQIKRKIRGHKKLGGQGVKPVNQRRLILASYFARTLYYRTALVIFPPKYRKIQGKF